MDKHVGSYLLSDDKNLLCQDKIISLLHKTYWAAGRTEETMANSIRNSLCFGIYLDGEQVGFARTVTDYATMFWLCDVVIDDCHRGKGLGKELIAFIVQTEELKGLRGILATKDAHGLYEQYGFHRNQERFMLRQDFT